MITFTVPGVPIGQPRHQITRTGRAYIKQAHPVHIWKAAVRLAAEAQNCELLRTAVDVEAIFYFPRPKAHFGTCRNAGLLKASAPTRHVSKPDIDNLQKALFDALSGVIFEDDRQIASALTEKYYAETPSSCITIRSLEN